MWKRKRVNKEWRQKERREREHEKREKSIQRVFFLLLGPHFSGLSQSSIIQSVFFLFFSPEMPGACQAVWPQQSGAQCPVHDSETCLRQKNKAAKRSARFAETQRGCSLEDLNKPPVAVKPNSDGGKRRREGGRGGCQKRKARSLFCSAPSKRWDLPCCDQSQFNRRRLKGNLQGAVKTDRWKLTAVVVPALKRPRASTAGARQRDAVKDTTGLHSCNTPGLWYAKKNPTAPFDRATEAGRAGGFHWTPHK